MTTYDDVLTYRINNLAEGYVSSFGLSTGPLYVLCNLDYTTGTYPNALTVRPMERAMPVPKLNDGIFELAGGRIYSPWSLAGRRAPTAYPQHVQKILYHGDNTLVMKEWEKLASLVGVTSVLTITYGRTTEGGAYAAKKCDAMLLPPVSTATRNLNRTTSDTQTWLEVTVAWQQVGAFSAA